ncbi:MAG: hypothetical protein ABSB74_04570 [Tepidisphaeraceae bacterium]
MDALSLPRAAWALGIGLGIGVATNAVSAQVSTRVTVLADTPLQYANSSVEATMPATGLGLHTSVYANQWGNASLPGLIKASGVQMLRYPGGSYADLYNWSTGTGNAGAYIAAHSDIGNFIHVMDESHTTGMVTINYGSNTTDTIGGQPQEAAACVAYANANPSIYRGAADVVLGTDAAGIKWYTAGYWAKLRSSTPGEYQSWATAVGDYNPSFSFLAIHHPAAVHVKYWEIGNEVGGNGYSGIQWEYDLHARYKNGNSKDNAGRKQNPLLSPAAYAHNFIQFARLMKSVDPTIKIGAGFAAFPNNSGDSILLQIAGDYIDFGIIHWYPNGANASDPVGSLPGAVISGPFSLSQLVSNLRKSARIYAYKGANDFEINITEFNYAAQNPSMVSYALFAADAYVTGFENGVRNMDLLEMIGRPYLGDGPPQPAGEYYGIQMVSRFASTGDQFVSTVCRDPKLRVHAVKRPDGTVALLFVNDGSASDMSQDRRITATLMGVPSVAKHGTLYLFGVGNITGSTIRAPTAQKLNGLGNPFTLTIPQQTIGVLVLSEAAPLPTMLFSISTLLIGRRLRPPLY